MNLNKIIYFVIAIIFLSCESNHELIFNKEFDEFS
ncbi:MAG: hypothetical protein ACI956_000896, partial [Nonlabens sp.]